MYNFPALSLPSRESKPRRNGLTSVIDSGTPFGAFEVTVRDLGGLIDFVKFGWGTSVVAPSLRQKIGLLKELKIDFWLGGTLFEAAYLQDKTNEYIDWAKSLGCEYFEISDGSIEMEIQEKQDWIARLSEDFRVLSEVGSKDVEDVMSPSEWTSHILQELKAGAWKVIAEGRESGNAGIYRRTGEVRSGLIKELQQVDIDFNDIIFEAPLKAQQVWFISHIGPQVNLANIAFNDVTSLETLRLGLRSDTISMLLDLDVCDRQDRPRVRGEGPETR